jgi:hypothetical protein
MTERAFPPILCNICNKRVGLYARTTVTDEQGQPVHEQCYAQKVIIPPAQ